MQSSTQVFGGFLLMVLVGVTTAISVDVPKTPADAERPTSGVYRASYKEPRPARSSARNLARDEAIAPTGDRIGRSSAGKAQPLVSRLLLERQAQDASDASHSVSVHHDDKHGEGPFSYQQYDIDASQEEQQLQGHLPEHGEEEHGEGHDEVHYQYMYQVAGTKEGDGDYGHAEARDGHKTWGRYFVNQPDGRIKTVRYWADKTGYHAKVEYLGEAAYPEKKPEEYGEH